MKTKTSKIFKAILAIVLTLSIVLSCVIGGSAMLRQPKKLVTDLTSTPQESTETESGSSGDKKDTHAYISPNVTMFQEDDAAAINAAITELTTTSAGVYLTAQKGSKLDQLGVGDVFFLDGSEDTPIGEPYFGKIAATKTVDGRTQLLLETPTLDEVFDSISFDTSSLFDEDVEATFTGLEGVTVSSGGTPAEIQDVDLSNTDKPTATPLSLSSKQPKISTLDPYSEIISDDYSSCAESTDKTWNFDPEESLEISLEIDLLKAYKMLKGDKTDDNSSKQPDKDDSNSDDNERISVYITPKGYAYHRKDCFHLNASKTVSKVDLFDSSLKDRSPCKHCKPPVPSATSTPDDSEKPNDTPTDSDNHYAKHEESLKLTGKVGIENLDCSVYLDWDILSGNGVQDLKVDITGTAFAEVGIKGSAEFKLGGQDTEWTSPLGSIKVQGLQEKLFPIGYISLLQSFACVPSLGSQATVRAAVTSMPLSILIMVYVDVQGNLTFSLSANAKWSRDFEFSHALVEDGKINMKPELTAEDTEFTWGLEAGVEGDLDVHFGLSALVYVYNINVLDVAIFKYGTNAEGKLALSLNNETLAGTEPWYEASFYARKYFKLLDIKLKIKASAEFFKGLISLGGELKWEWTLLDHTLATFGEKLPTRYAPGVMSYSHITAKDGDAIYYKDEDGRLIMEKDKHKTVLYEEDFFIICGIDDSFLYILKQKDGGAFTMYRLSTENQTVKEILSDVSYVLSWGEEYIYYLDGFDNTVIRQYHRFTETTDTFCDLPDSVQFMTKQNDDFYVGTKYEDAFSFLFGSTNYYYLIDSKGNIIQEYGSNPEVADLELTDRGNFYQAGRIVDGGILRRSASAVYWLSEDKTQNVLIEDTSGWNGVDNIGIFACRSNPDTSEGAAPYQIQLHKAEDGSVVSITEVQSNQAFFTLTQSQTGDWYFFDQTDTELILYRMNEDFTGKEMIKAFSLEELPFNLTDCGMTAMDNCLYFYSIVDDKVCTVIKRYDLY